MRLSWITSACVAAALCVSPACAQSGADIASQGSDSVAAGLESAGHGSAHVASGSVMVALGASTAAIGSTNAALGSVAHVGEAAATGAGAAIDALFSQPLNVTDKVIVAQPAPEVPYDARTGAPQ